MNAHISPSKIAGIIQAPPSKSYTHRAILLAALAKGQSEIRNYLHSKDTDVTIECCKRLGVAVNKKSVDCLTIQGTDGFRKVSQSKKLIVLNCIDSGTTARLITSIAAITPYQVKIVGSTRLQSRPMNELITALRFLGIPITELDKHGYLPFLVSGGNLQGGRLEINAHKSSQFVSALLLAAPFTKEDMIIKATSTSSRPYIDITIDMMKSFGVKVDEGNGNYKVKRGSYRAIDYTIEGDFSSASYFFAAAAITGGSILVKGLNAKSLQADTYILDILKMMGCKIEKSSNRIKISGKANKPINIDLGNYPDIVPTVAAVAAAASGVSTIRNIGHLRYKESDRIHSIAQVLKRMNVDVKAKEDSLTIRGTGKLKSATIDTYGDHRIAMSFAIAALAAEGKTTIKDAAVVEKSFPAFWEDFKKIGAEITLV